MSQMGGRDSGGRLHCHQKGTASLLHTKQRVTGLTLTSVLWQHLPVLVPCDVQAVPCPPLPPTLHALHLNTRKVQCPTRDMPGLGRFWTTRSLGNSTRHKKGNVGPTCEFPEFFGLSELPKKSRTEVLFSAKEGKLGKTQISSLWNS